MWINALLAIKLCTAINEQGTRSPIFWTKALGVNISFKEALLGIEMHFSQSSCALPSMSKELKITKALLDQGSWCQHLLVSKKLRNALWGSKCTSRNRNQLCTAIDEQGTEDHQGSFGPRLLVSTSRSKKLGNFSQSSCALPSMSKELKIIKALLDQGSWCQHLVQRSFVGDRMHFSQSSCALPCTSRNQAVHCHR